MKKAVVLLSGGLDSTTLMGIAQADGYEIFPISFDYGQRHRRELECARQIAEFYQVKSHRLIKVGPLGGSALTEADIDVPEYAEREEIPVTYVPARNILFLSYAVGYAEVVGAEAIYIGVNALDYSGYPDCRPEFIEAYQKAINLGTKAGAEGNPIAIKTPLLHLGKGDIVTLADKLGTPIHWTTSCYNGEEKACGVCDACRLRLKGFAEAGIKDPIKYYSGNID